jgi:hypothetical protein
MILFRELERAFLIPCEHQNYILLNFRKRGGGGGGGVAKPPAKGVKKIKI